MIQRNSDGVERDLSDRSPRQKLKCLTPSSIEVLTHAARSHQHHKRSLTSNLFAQEADFLVRRNAAVEIRVPENGPPQYLTNQFIRDVLNGEDPQTMESHTRPVHKNNYLYVYMGDSNILSTWHDGPNQAIADGAISTDNLCGCTVVLIMSKKATILVHIPESRLDDQWWLKENEAAQLPYDDHFIAEARRIISEQLEPNRHLFVPHESTSRIIAPKVDPAYLPLRYIGAPSGYYFPNQVRRLNGLLRELTRSAQVHESEYYPRFTTDDSHMSDPRDTVVLLVRPQGRRLEKSVINIYISGKHEGFLELGPLPPARGTRHPVLHGFQADDE